MGLPDLTHLQFLILSLLLDGEQPGRFIREKLAEEGERKTGPAFYQMMARLEDSKFVEGWYNQKVVEGQMIKERWYKITGHGVAAWESTRAFYQEHARLKLKGGVAHA
jgi:DNA-binding PadR family transcriptional regulator